MLEQQPNFETRRRNCLSTVSAVQSFTKSNCSGPTGCNSLLAIYAIVDEYKIVPVLKPSEWLVELTVLLIGQVIEPKVELARCSNDAAPRSPLLRQLILLFHQHEVVRYIDPGRESKANVTVIKCWSYRVRNEWHGEVQSVRRKFRIGYFRHSRWSSGWSL